MEGTPNSANLSEETLRQNFRDAKPKAPRESENLAVDETLGIQIGLSDETAQIRARTLALDRMLS